MNLFTNSKYAAAYFAGAKYAVEKHAAANPTRKRR
jgi:hypothetical protein